MKTMIQAAAVTLIAASAAHAQQAVQWKVSDGGNGHWYQYVPTRVTWHQASAACLSRGGQLVTLGSAAENAFVNGIVTSRYLAGGFQPSAACEPGCDWQWSSGEPWIYTNWNPGEPNDMGGEDYLLVNPGFPGWNDITTESIEYVIEWSADCNGDGIVDYGQIQDGYLPDLDGDNLPDCCEQGVTCVQLGFGLEAHFEFDDDCLDASGNGRHGVSTGLAYALGPEGLPGTAAVFDGSSSDVRIQGVPIPTNNAFSWAMWLRADSIGNAAVLERIESIGNNLMSPSLWVRSDGALGFGSYSFQSGGTSVETSSNTLTAGAWIHVACTSARSGLRRVYVNGTLVGENLSADYGQPLPMILIGRDRLDCCSRFRGAIDDLRIYGRPLTPAEVDALYRAASLCAGDIVEDDNVNGADLGALLFYWGAVTSSPLSRACDLDRSGTVDGADLGALLASWGACP